jgi:hypothetical protein
MATNAIHPVRASSDTERPVPRWAVITAHAIFWVLLPQCLWRLPFAVDFRMGMIDPNLQDWVWNWWEIPYVLGLSVLTEGLALLCLGLVRGWGEVAPAWLPMIGGRRIPPFAAIIPATLGGLAATAFWGAGLLAWFDVPGFESPIWYSNGWWEALAKVCIAPGMLWGPMVLALTYAYYVRRCRPGSTER